MGRADFRNDLTGRRFGKVVALEYMRGKGRWKYACDCGRSGAATGANLLSGGTLSCGCSRGESIATHGRTGTPLFAVWSSMRMRCQNPNDKNYKRYGGRGIKVCDRWQDFSAFFADMGEPAPGLSLDRYPDQDGNYEPGNCRWATASQQQRNRSNNRILEFDGKRMPITEWAEQTGLRRVTISSRLKRGWSLEDALTLPVGLGRAS